jgi:Fe-S cluster assembly ATP-binding protein
MEWGEPMLEVIDLTVVVGERRILHDLNLQIRHAEIHSILGANGTGKSTLAAVLMGLSGYELTGGRILFQGEDISGLSISERARRGITLAWQEPARFEGLTVREYLEISRRRAGEGSLSPKECLAKVGLNPEKYLQRMVDATLSGGERKRVELASVLAMNPKFVILDEPDSGIDALSIDNIVGVIRTLSRGGSAVLLITHHEEVAAMADRASSLCGGTILKTGDPVAITRFFRNHCQECQHVNEPRSEEIPYA